MKIVIIRFSSFGDCVLLCPLVAHLKHSGADEVVVVTKNAYAEIFECAEGVDRVIAFDPNTGLGGLSRIARDVGDDCVVIDAHNNWRSRFLSWRLGGAAARLGKHYRERLGLILFKKATSLPTILEQYGRLSTGVDIAAAPAVPGGLNVPETMRARVPQTSPSLRGAVAVAPGSRWPAKRWDKGRFLELATALVKTHGRHVVLVGDRDDAQFARPIAEALGAGCTDATGAGSIMETAAWIERCDAFVGNDSGLMHLAEAVGVPVVGLFGPTVREFGYFPALERSGTVERAAACRPCSRNGARPCPRAHQVCLDIDTDEVERALAEILAGGDGRATIVQ